MNLVAGWAWDGAIMTGRVGVLAYLVGPWVIVTVGAFIAERIERRS